MSDGQVARVAKINEELGLVFGWAVVCKVNGQDYYDLNIDSDGERVPEHITEAAMLKAASEFMLSRRAGNEMHAGPDKGTYVFAWPMTTEIAKALGISTPTTGLLVCYKPPPEVFDKFRSGKYRGFSIEGSRVKFQDLEKRTMKRRVLHEIRLDKIAAVDKPAQEGALVAFMKFDPKEGTMLLTDPPAAPVVVRKTEPPPRRPEGFQAIVDDLVKRGLSRTAAMTKARRENPAQFLFFQTERNVSSRPVHKGAAKPDAVAAFEGLVESIQIRKGLSKSAAMSVARVEHPREFAAYQEA